MILCLLVKVVSLSGTWNPQQSNMVLGMDEWWEEGILPTILVGFWTRLESSWLPSQSTSSFSGSES